MRRHFESQKKTQRKGDRLLMPYKLETNMHGKVLNSCSIICIKFCRGKKKHSTKIAKSFYVKEEREAINETDARKRIPFLLVNKGGPLASNGFKDI